MDITFPSGAQVIFAHMEHEKNRYDWVGSGSAFFGFDEGHHFTEKQFWYVSLARARTRTGLQPSVRLTCNPDPDSFLAELLSWWWDAETGYAIPERSGVIRWFRRIEDKHLWYESLEEASADPDITVAYGPPLSFTFIHATLEDNPELLRTNPQYRARLNALSYVERERLARGNWKIRETAGRIFKAEWFKIVPAYPRGLLEVRYWDKAGTEEEEATTSSSRTACCRMARDLETGRFFVPDAHAGYYSDIDREKLIRQYAETDGDDITTWIEREPGSGGKDSAKATIRNLVGFDAREERVTGSKISRWRPWSASVENGDVFLVAGGWNKDFIEEHRNADPRKRGNDLVDAASGAHGKLAAETIAGTW
jgi:phage terminase large subunit-like protein